MAEEKTNEKKVTKIASGKVKKKSGARKLADTVIAEDMAKVKDYIVMDVVIPALKKTIQDVVTNTIDMLLYGESGRRTSSSISATKVSFRDYNRMSDKNYRRPVTNRSTYSYDDVVVDNRGEAEAVLQQMDEILSQYQVVTVADLYDLVGVTGSYTDNKYGWTDLRAARVERVREGYLIKLPRVMPID